MNSSKVSEELNALNKVTIEELHNEFLQKQPYKNSKIKCDEIVKKIQSNKISISIDLTLIEQAYINAKLGWNYFS